ncbi:nucleoside-diphosphate-sugar epimerase [Thaumarchaeota archaeon SCGC AB-539-E09]|nr:nucleoside-diphosphate-sugar epimerase [Thaumarchaeota archaeon SCGC AB-539-E09]
MFEETDLIIDEDLQKISNDVSKDFFESRKILVTGGGGFIGSFLCESLLLFNANVTCVDNFITGDMGNISRILNNDNFTLINKDVLDFTTEEEYDYIFHLASRAAPDEYVINPIKTLRISALGSNKILEVARQSNSTILFTSTSETYGDSEVLPTPETYWGYVNPVGKRSCYDEGKRYAESLFMAFYRQYGLDVRIVRIFNTYGPRLRADGAYARAMSRFITQALDNVDITVYGDGMQTRSFCYVSDTVTGILLTMINNETKGDVVNIGNPNETHIIDLAKKIKDISNSKSKITFHELPEDDPKRRCPDISKAKQLIEWEPRISLEEGLKRTIKWFRPRVHKNDV